MRSLVIRTVDHAELVKEESLLARLNAKNLDFVLVALLIFLLVTSIFVFHVWSRLYVFRTGYEIYQQEKTKQELLEENRILTMEVASLKSPARIERIARDDLGLRSPRPEQVVMVNPRERL
jgi:cell division protein FtsL